MFGVVLWSDPHDRKAVFWCEDQGDLAYFEEDASQPACAPFFNAGDMVQFEAVMEDRLRKAVNPLVVQQKACLGLPETLRSNGFGSAQPSPPDRASSGSAKILAFVAKDDQSQIAASDMSKLKA